MTATYIIAAILIVIQIETNLLLHYAKKGKPIKCKTAKE